MERGSLSKCVYWLWEWWINGGSFEDCNCTVGGNGGEGKFAINMFVLASGIYHSFQSFCQVGAMEGQIWFARIMCCFYRPTKLMVLRVPRPQHFPLIFDYY